MTGRIWAPEAIGDRRLKADACVIGSGAGGAVVASALARAGLSVVILEEGPYVPTEAFPLDPRRAMPTLYRNGGATLIAGNSPLLFTEGRCVGGSTTVNAGICYRAPEAVLEGGGRVRVEAELVILAAGALQTPQLLFKSGLNTREGLVGQNLYVHPNCKIIGEFEEETCGWKGAVQGLQVDQFAQEGYTFFSTFVPPGLMAFGLPVVGDAAFSVMENYNRLASWGVLIEDGHPGRVLPGRGDDPRAIYHFDAEDRRRILRGIRLLAELFFAAEARRLFLPLHRLPEVRTPAELSRLEGAAPRMADIEILTVHAMGTCRMSARPDRGVVDAWNEHHEVEGLFVADASALPGPLRVNPMLTIMALAERCAAGILGRRGVRVG